MEANVIDTKVSGYLSFMNCLCTVFIVSLHSSCEFMLDSYLNHIFYRILYALYSVAVPYFFMSSAFLFYWKIEKFNQRVYKEKITKRFISLIVPYFLYSLIWMMLFALLYQTPVIGDVIRRSSMLNEAAFDIKSFLLSSFDPPLWYLRTLFLLHLISPLFYLISKRLSVEILTGVFMLVLIINLIIMPPYSSVLFWIPIYFFGGGILAKYYKGIYYFTLKRLQKHRILIELILILIFVLFLIMAANCNDNSRVYYLYRNIGMLLLAMILFLIFKIKTFNKNYNFFIYMMHYPIAHFVNKMLSTLIPSTKFIAVQGLYIITIVSTIFLIVMVGKLLEKNSRVWRVLNGGR